MPRERRRRGPQTGRGPLPWEEPNAVKATISPSAGASFTGALVRLTDFDVTIHDDSGRTLSWLRSGNVPKVQVTDPLQGHIDLLPKYKDADIHNLAAYLATLK